MNKYLRQFLESNTHLGEQEMREIMERILVSTYQKGTVLLKQGDISDKCYFVLKGCIRQYAIGDDGKETTYNFFTEGQSVVLFKSYKQRVPSENVRSVPGTEKYHQDHDGTKLRPGPG